MGCDRERQIIESGPDLVADVGLEIPQSHRCMRRRSFAPQSSEPTNWGAQWRLLSALDASLSALFLCVVDLLNQLMLATAQGHSACLRLIITPCSTFALLLLAFCRG